MCFKFHQNHTINEEFDFWRGGWAKFFRGPPKRAGGLDYKNTKKPNTERWSQPTPKISVIQHN